MKSAQSQALPTNVRTMPSPIPRIVKNIAVNAWAKRTYEPAAKNALASTKLRTRRMHAPYPISTTPCCPSVRPRIWELINWKCAVDNRKSRRSAPSPAAHHLIYLSNTIVAHWHHDCFGSRAVDPPPWTKQQPSDRLTLRCGPALRTSDRCPLSANSRREQLQQNPYSECLEAHSISSSASVSSEGGTVRPSALATLTLMTSSNLVGCSTGRSAGFAPFRILSTKVAARR